MQRGKWWAMSGKVMQDAIPTAGTAMEELRRTEESGHAIVTASLLQKDQALPAPKPEVSVILLTVTRK
jgi:hypothetical protein